MKISVLLLVAGLIISCQPQKKEKEKIVIGSEDKKMTSSELGKNLFNGKGNCYTCHKIDKKSIGPSIASIMQIYKEKNGNIIGFLKQQEDPIVDPKTYAVMKANFAVLKTFSDEELKALEDYMNDAVK